MQKRTIVAALAIAGIVGISTTTGAIAGSLVGSADVRNDSLRSVDLKNGSAVGEDDLRPALKAKVNAVGTGEQGPAGAAGATGPQGIAGANGTDGLDGAVYRSLTYTNGGGGSATVACADDNTVSQTYTAVAGGVQGGTVETQDDGFVVNSSFPGRMDWDAGVPKADRLDGWIILGNGQYTSTLTVWALCVPNTSIAVQADTLDN